MVSWVVNWAMTMPVTSALHPLSSVTVKSYVPSGRLGIVVEPSSDIVWLSEVLQLMV